MSGKEEMSSKNIEFFFNPASVAVVGASTRPGKISNIIIKSLKESGFPGAIYPVNPAHTEVEGLRCYPALKEIGANIDLAVFAVPAEAVPGALREASGQVKGAIIVGGGFGETGLNGAELEDEVRQITREGRIRVMGPNCMGIYDAVSRLDTFFISRDRICRPKKGGISVLSQSGSFAVAAMDELASEGIGVARVISYGNKADVNESDCLEFLADDPDTTAVALYIESVDNGRRFMEAARLCSSRKPVMAVKVGKGGPGASAARSHTGAMAGRYEAYRAAFKKAGVLELEGYEDFITGCKALGALLPAKGRRVAIITDGGGVGVNLADACGALGLEIPLPGDDTIERLRSVFPPYFVVGNPIDLTGSATDDLYAEAIKGTLGGDSFDLAIVAALWGPPGLTDRLAGLIAEEARQTGKPVIVCSPGGAYSREKDRLFREAGLPVFTTPEAAARAARTLAGFSQPLEAV